MTAKRKRQVAGVCAGLTAVTLLIGVYGWQSDSGLVLALTATPMFGILALTFALSAQHLGDDADG